MTDNEKLVQSEAEMIAQAKAALTRALDRKAWREDGWEVPAIDVQEALDALSHSLPHCDGCAKFEHHHCYHCGKRAGLPHPAYCPNFDQEETEKQDEPSDASADTARRIHGTIAQIENATLRLRLYVSDLSGGRNAS